MPGEQLLSQALGWHDDDPDPRDQAELAAVVSRARAGDAAAAADLHDRFAAPLTFGTAGLRGPMRAGPAGINTAVVRRTSAGLAAWLLHASGPGGRAVVGWEGRHRSAELAGDAAAVLAGAGLEVFLLPEAMPTPLLAFAVRHTGAELGVMITASHNPAADNGYKVYLGGAVTRGDPAATGAQLVPPVDAQVQRAARAAGRAVDIPLGTPAGRLGPELLDAYLQGALALLAPSPPAGPARQVHVAYTPLHGVGRQVMERAFDAAGFPAPLVVAEQADPDPDFPTVAYPNPEEPGACDLLIELAAATGADVALANDPDADRLAVAVGGRLLTGDELGLLLADHALGRRPGPVATSLVSSSALGRLAAARGVSCTTTLTGFKWIMRAAPDLVLGYEEALGYAVAPELVRDKDGISAALLVTELAALERQGGRTLLDRLDDLAREIGLAATRPLTVRLSAPAEARDILSRLRADPPGRLAGHAVAAVDLNDGWHGLPPTEGIVLHGDGVRAVVRPSGTEPKLKAYLEATALADQCRRDLTATREQLAGVLERMHDELARRLQVPAHPQGTGMPPRTAGVTPRRTGGPPRRPAPGR